MYKGEVTRHHDKPFVSVRESLWLDSNNSDHNKYYGYPERVAQRLNAYTKDYTKIEGYSLVLAHVWSSGTMPLFCLGYNEYQAYAFDKDVNQKLFPDHFREGLDQPKPRE